MRKMLGNERLIRHSPEIQNHMKYSSCANVEVESRKCILYYAYDETLKYV
jgi:hypothetical protein